MDPIGAVRFAALTIGGFALGYGATLLVDTFGGDPIWASAAVAAGAVAVALALRREEFLNLVVESAIYAYGAYIGMALLRTAGPHNAIGDEFLMPGLFNGITAVVLLVGAAYTMAIVFMFAIPAWGLASRSSEWHPKGEAFWAFVDSQVAWAAPPHRSGAVCRPYAWCVVVWLWRRTHHRRPRRKSIVGYRSDRRWRSRNSVSLTAGRYR